MFENSVLVASSFTGDLIFFDVKDLQSEPQKVYQENIGDDPSLQCDKNLLYSSMRQHQAFYIFRLVI